jgi:RING finger/CHY zinc finger protein 1
MCERDDDKCSSGCCSECDFDEWVDYTLGTTSDEEEGEERGEEGEEATDNATDATDAREISKFEEKEKDKKENCGHYISGCKIIAKCCDREFGCRICHDFEISEHEINRYEIEEIVCNDCKTRQPVSNTCINKECRFFVETFASYYCDVCHLYSDKPASEIYHCEKCKICRMCGVGNKPSDFFHCDKCGGCIHTNLENTHKCVSDAFRNDCCICLDNIFLSREPTSFLPCGHVIHSSCLNSSLKQNKYTCPLCRKIMIQGSMLEVMIQHYDNMISLYPYDENIETEITCNDCDFKGKVSFHPFGLKCGNCGGYNTHKIR